MELRYLRYFVAVAEELNFRKASERLYVSTPTLSVQIKTLEGLLGVELLKRDTSVVRLTAAGEVLLREARELLEQQKQMETATKEAARGEGGSLRVGDPGYFSYSFMRQALTGYHERYPKVDLSLVTLDPELEHPQALESGSIQIGFVYGPMLRFMKDIEHMLVVDTTLQAIMGATHPLAALKEVPLAKMTEYPLLTLQRYDSHLGTMLGFFQQKKLAPKVIKKVDGFTAYTVMLSAGKDVSIMPYMRIFELFPAVALRPIKDKGLDLRLELHAVWKKGDVAPQVRSFVEVLREAGVRSR